VAAAAVLFVPELTGPGPTGGVELGSSLSGGLLVPSAVLFLAGLLTSLTPCVYPLIPITLGVFGAGKTSSRGRAVALTLTYILGISVTFVSLGLFFGLTGELFGSLLGNPIVVSLLAVFFVGLAASMFGAFELRLPSFLQSKAASVRGVGFPGAFAMGLVAGFIAAPCTGPVLSAVLVDVATNRDALRGGVLLFAYSLGIGVPFFLIGAFALSLPKSGPWMNTVKSVFGIALLGMAVFYLRDGFPWLRERLTLELPFGAWLAAGLVAIGVFAGAAHRTFSSGFGPSSAKVLGIGLVVAGLALRPDAPLARPEPVAAVEWLTSESAAVERALAEKKPVLVDFSAEWCSACKELDKYVFRHRLFAREANRFLLVRIDATSDSDPEIKRLRQKYEVRGLPTVLFIDSNGKVQGDLTVKGFLDPAQFLARMQQVR